MAINETNEINVEMDEIIIPDVAPVAEELIFVLFGST